MTDDTSQFGLGRLPSIPDERNSRYAIQPLEAPSNLVRKVWPYDQIFDQGASSQCVAFAGIASLIASPSRNFPNMTFEMLYKECQRNDRWPGEDYEGTSVHGLCIVLKKMGFITEYRWATRMDQVVQHLLTKGPLVAGTLWLRDMFAVDSKGFLRVGGTEEGGHAYLVLGVDLERKCPDGSTGSLLIANSWGRRWGKKDAKGKQTGRAFISMKDFQTLMAADGEVATVTEVKRN